MTAAEHVPPPKPSRLWKVMARVEGVPTNGKCEAWWIAVRTDLPRGTAEAIQVQVARDGFRVDSDREAMGSTYYPAHRILLVEVVANDMEVSE